MFSGNLHCRHYRKMINHKNHFRNDRGSRYIFMEDHASGHHLIREGGVVVGLLLAGQPKSYPHSDFGGPKPPSANISTVEGIITQGTPPGPTHF